VTTTRRWNVGQQGRENNVHTISPTVATTQAPQDRAAAVTTDILKIVARALTGWLYHETADLAGVRAIVEARVRAEIEAALPPMCADCGVNRSDPPSKLCPGCEAYRDHTDDTA
jgi:hypothetical protein